MPDDPRARSQPHEPGSANLEQLTPPGLLGLTRRALSSIYTPEQTVVWLAAHARGDPVEVARKARRLCGIDDHEPVAPQQMGSDPRVPRSPDTRCLDPDGRPLPSATRQAHEQTDAGLAVSASRNVERPLSIEKAHDRVQDVLMTDALGAGIPVYDAVLTASSRLLAVDGPPAAGGDRSGPRGDAQRRHLSELQVHEILLAAIRGIFTCEQPEEIQAILLETIGRLGGRITRAADADERSIPVDLSLNLGEPLLVVPATEQPDLADHLRAHLPRLVEDARQALDRMERSGRLTSDAEHDALTGLFNRRAYERFAGRLHPGDVLVLLDLDDFKLVNDTHGHLVGDQILRIFGSVLREQMRITEQAVRLGGDEFLIVLEQPGEGGAELLLERLRVAWYRRRPKPVTFSSGIAAVTSGVDEALEAADRALYERKRIKSRTVPGRWNEQ